MRLTAARVVAVCYLAVVATEARITSTVWSGTPLPTVTWTTGSRSSAGGTAVSCPRRGTGSRESRGPHHLSTAGPADRWFPRSALRCVRLVLVVDPDLDLGECGEVEAGVELVVRDRQLPLATHAPAPEGE